LLLTDHHSLTNYFKQPTLNVRQGHWVDFLRIFEFEVRHLKGKENKVANALGLKLNFLYEISFNESRTTFYEQIRETTMEDLVYKRLWRQEKIENNHEHKLGYEVNPNEILIYMKRLYVTNQKLLKNSILDEYHKSPYARHPGY